MRRTCNICQKPYLYKVSNPITLELAPPVCSEQCFTSLLYQTIAFSTPIAKELLTKYRTPDCYRSKFETQVNDFLLGLDFQVYYEAVAFRPPDEGKWYLPDFMVTKKPFVGQIFIEAKGIWQAGAHTKVRKFREELEECGSNIWVIDDDVLRRLRGKS